MGLGHTSDWLSPSRLFSWALLRFLNRVFMSVQLHKGQMKMVHKAAQAVRPALHRDGDGGSRGQAKPQVGTSPISWWEKSTAL